MKMTARDQDKIYHNELLQIMQQAGLVSAEEHVSMEEYLWTSLEKGVN